MNRNKSVKCKICGKKYVSKQALIDHIEKTHASNIPEGWNAARYENYLRTGKTEGRCVYCKKETGWNDATGKYNRMCGSEACKKKAREIANKNYIGLHGKPYTINDPEQQKKMVYGRKNSGKYIFEDEETGKKYTAMYDSSYGKDFFEMLDTFLNWDGSDIIAPSPHTYWYEYEGKKHFYIPDAYSTSLNLEIELKDGGDNPNKHPKIQAVDKVKEQKKDEVMASLKDQVNYIKICNKDYSEFFELLSRLKEKDVCQLPKWEGRLESITESYISDDIVTEAMGFNIYRVSYNGIGIYEALHKKLMEENKYDEWKNFLNSSDVNWLPKPPEYPEYYRSYFTEKGFNKFKSKTLPIMTKYLDKNEIKIEKSKYSGDIKYLDDYQIVVVGEPVEEVETDDSKLNRAESFSYYHLEEKQVKNGCWDEEQWFKTLPDAIKQELSQVSYKGVEGCTRKGNMTRFVYTLGKNNQTICLGRINVYWYDWYDHMESPDYEWAETFGINMALIDEELNPIKGKTPILEDPLLEGKFKAINPNLIKRDLLLKDPMLNYDKLIDFYHKRLFHENLNQKEWQYTYNELYKVREHLQKVVNKSSSENDKRMKYEAKKALVEVNNMIAYMEEKNTDRLPVSENIEMMLSTNPLDKEITLYHGSHYQEPLKIISPVSKNVGTKFSSPRMSSFWAIDKTESMKFAVFKLVSEYACESIFNPENGEIITLEDMPEKDILKKIIDKKVYVYSKTINKKYVGRGHAAHMNEFTIDIPVSPDTTELISKEFITKYISGNVRYIGTSDPKEQKRIIDKMIKEGDKKSVVKSKWVYHDYDKFIDLNKELKKIRTSVSEAKELKKKPVYIISWHYNSLVGYSSRIATKSYYNHTSISLTPDLEKCYAFSRNPEFTKAESTNGFCNESLSYMIKRHRESVIKVDAVYLPENCVESIKKSIEYHEKHQADSKFDYINFGRIVLGIELKETNPNKMICSMFVDKLFKDAGVDLTNGKPSNLVTPADIAEVSETNRNVFTVYSGKAINYDKNKAGRITMESTLLESTKSSVDPNYKPKGKIKLSSLKRVRITESIINKYKKEYPFLKHVRYADTKEYICDGYIWFDGDNLVAMVGSCEYTDDKTKWIVSLEITKNYKGYGLSPQILDYATKTMKCKYLSVNKNNKLAKKIYDDYGFKVYEESETMYYMTIDSNRKTTMESTLLESSNNSKMYFLSDTDMNGRTLTPRIPDNYFTKNGYEDKSTKRVCFAPSIDKSLMALSYNLKGKEFYVHVPIGNYDVYKPSKDEVPDSKVTGELWVTKPVKISCIGKIKVIGDKGLDGHKFKYGDKEAELYDWEWEWIDKPISETYINSSEMEDDIMENYLINQKDIYYNKDKFDSGEVNLCFITGHSGSGKTTMASSMQKDNIEHYQLDDLLCVKDHFTMDNLKEYGDLFYSYFNGVGKKFYLCFEDIKERKISGSDYEDKLFPNFIHYAMKYAKSHRDKKYVIEGVWLFCTSEKGKNYFEPSEFEDYAFYIKGTSSLISKYRAAKRDAKSDTDNKFDEFRSFAKNFFTKNLKWYLLDEKRIQKFRDYFSDKTVTESTYIEGTKDGTKYYPVFIFLSYTGTNMARLIKSFTHDPYAHSSISFDTELDHMVSFNRDGMVEENIKNGIWKTNANSIKYSLYMYLATAEEYDAMRNFVNELLDKRNKLKYNLLGLTNFIFGRGSEREDRFFCSEFVSSVISAGNKNIIKTKPFMTSPYMLAKNKNFKFIKKGVLKNYNPKAVDNLIKDIMEEEGGFIDVIIK